MLKFLRCVMAFASACAVLPSGAIACSPAPDTRTYEERVAERQAPTFRDALTAASGAYVATARITRPSRADERRLQKWGNLRPRAAGYRFDVERTVFGRARGGFRARLPKVQQRHGFFMRPPEGAMAKEHATGRLIAPEDRDLIRHADAGFWDEGHLALSHSGTMPDCSTSRWFVRGQTYLVLLDDDGRLLSAEVIAAPDDA